MKQNKFKKFFTLQHRANDGFTLVELVIVIAILAILAGVAVPVYNGYTDKAREAADQMIIAAANDAFAAACMENAVDSIDVEEAEISVIDSQIYGISKAVDNGDATFVDKVAPYFNAYFEGNEEMVFNTPNVNSLIWNDTLDTFEMSASFIATRVVLSSGKTITVSAEDMAAILGSTYANMGYSGVAATLNNVAKSGETLASLVGKANMLSKLTDAMKAYGLIDDTKAKELQDAMKFRLFPSNEQKAAAAKATQETANGLSMITAKYLAGGGNIQELIDIPLGNSSLGVITPLATGTGGTKTVSAIAVQYALVSGFANSSASAGVTIEGKSVAEYLASADDPVKAIATVKALPAYQNNYVSADPNSQYQKDINGFVGTMSILGDNVGTLSQPGNIDINDYLSNGLGSNDAKDILTGVLGE